MPYRNFDLKLSGDKQQGYYVEVLNSPQSTRSNPWHLKLPEEEIKRWRSEVEGGSAGRQLARRLGGSLYEALFPSEILRIWEASKRDLSPTNPVRLRLDIRSQELAAIPWEIMHDGLNYLTLTAQIPLVRYLYNHPLIQTVEDSRPLNILLLVSTPHDAPPLPKIEREVELISSSIARLQNSGRIGRLDVIQHVTRQRLQGQLRQHDYHVLHYMGHGEFDDDNGHLIFEDEVGRAQWVDGEMLSNYFRDAPLRLLFLNACQTAVPSQANSLLGAAHAALAAGVPAIVAMQDAIKDNVAATFAHEFYLTLAEQRPLEVCMVEARKAIMNEDGSDWAIPALFSSVDEGLLWQSPEAKKIGDAAQGQGEAIQFGPQIIGSIKGNDTVVTQVANINKTSYYSSRKRKKRD